MGTISHPPIFGETESKNLMYFQSKGTQNVNVLNKYLPRKHRYHGESKSQHELLRTIYMSISWWTFETTSAPETSQLTKHLFVRSIISCLSKAPIYFKYVLFIKTLIKQFNAVGLRIVYKWEINFNDNKTLWLNRVHMYISISPLFQSCVQQVFLLEVFGKKIV